MMRKCLERWDRFFFSPYDPLPAAYFRICVGMVLLISLLANSPNWFRNLSAYGMPGYHDPGFGPIQVQWWSLLYWTRNWVPGPLFGWLAVILAVGYLVGYRTKACALALLLTLSGMYFRNWLTSNAEDTTFRMFMFYSLWLPVGDRLSLDHRRSQSTPPPQRSLWPVRMVQIHILLVYLISTPTKWMSDPAWPSGDALYYVMINPMWSRWPWPGLFYHAGIARMATWGSLAMEGSFPFLVWVRPLRRPMVAAMMCFHLMMAITLANITFFSIAFGCGLWLFFSAEDLGIIQKRIRRIFEHICVDRPRTAGYNAPASN